MAGVAVHVHKGVLLEEVLADHLGGLQGELIVGAQGVRIVKVFWSLDASLAYRRHFPAINWLNSYSLYLDTMKPWFDEHYGPSSG